MTSIDERSVLLKMLLDKSYHALDKDDILEIAGNAANIRQSGMEKVVASAATEVVKQTRAASHFIKQVVHNFYSV